MIERRNRWIDEIGALSGEFTENASHIEDKLLEAIRNTGIAVLLEHLRLCSAIPESYGHDSSEEKLYSKYTDILLSASYSQIGLQSVVLDTRANSADVEAVADSYSFVADAKAFRLSRTAKNQKDFKVQAMDNWKYGKPYAMVVCPLYQLPSTKSQIYKQAVTRNVCIFSYSHLAVIVQLSAALGPEFSTALLYRILATVEALNPSKDAISYWQAVNRAMLDAHSSVRQLWKVEKVASAEAIDVAKVHALSHFSREREKIMMMSREQAIRELVTTRKIDSRIEQIESVEINTLMDVNS